jgi:hypothetical protein
MALRRNVVVARVDYRRRRGGFDVCHEPVAWLLALGLVAVALARAPYKAGSRRGTDGAGYTGWAAA